MAELQNWYEKQQPYVEAMPDGDYWVVPVRFDKDDDLLNIFRTTTGQLQIQESLFKDDAMMLEIKEQALETLVAFLNKFPPATQELEAQSMIPDNATGFHVDVVPDGKLHIKVLFWKRWVDNLVESPTPTSTAEDPLLEEGMFATFLRGSYLISNIDKLVRLLNLFKKQIEESNMIVEGLDIDFEIEQLHKVKPALNRFIGQNFPGDDVSKYRLTSENDKRIDIGFTRDYRLLYVSMVLGNIWEPNPLSGQLTATSKFLNVGIDDLKSTPPFDHKRTNTFLFLLNDIVFKYGVLLQSPPSNRNEDNLPPWQDFINRFVYKDDSNEVVVLTNNTPQVEQETQSATEQTSTLPQVTDTITPVGPTPISPELKEELAREASNSSEMVIDTKLKEALDNSANIDSLEDVYGILNTISIGALTKLALSSVQTCLSPADVEEMYCKEDFISLTMQEVEGVIMPCLYNSAAATAATTATGALIAGPAAPVFVDRGYMADDLQSIIDSKRKYLLEKAQGFFPGNFEHEPDDDPLYSTNIPSADDIEKIETLYCTNSKFREQIGGNSPTDLKQELDDYFSSLSVEEKVTLCSCISDNYGSKVDSTSDFDLLLYTLGGAAIAALIANGSISPTMGALVADQLGIPMNALLGQDTPPTTDFIRDYQEQYEASLLDIVESILVGSIAMILELVKDKLFGGSPEQELCGAPSDLYPFGTISPLSLITQSPPRTRGNVPYGEFDAADIIADCFNKNKVRYAEVNQTVDFLNDVASLVTASGLRGLFKPSLSGMHTTKNFQRILDLAAKKYSDSIGKDLRTISKAKALFKCIGEFIDDALLQAFIDEAAALKNSALLICKEELCEDALYEQLLKYLSEEDALEQCRQNKLDNLEKIKNILPFLDNSKLQEMIPSLFCEPCTDKEVILPSLHESQSYLNETMNLEIYTLIDQSFNIDIDKYKPLLLDAKSDITSLIYGKSTDGSQNTKLTEIMHGIFSGASDSLKADLEAEKQAGKVAPRIYNEIAKDMDTDNIESWSESESSDLLATGQTKTTLTPVLQEIRYSTSSYSQLFVLLLNSGKETKTYTGLGSKLPIEVSGESIKLVIYDQNASKLELEHEFAVAMDVSQDSFEDYMMKHLAPYGGWGGESTINLEAISNVIGGFYGQVLTDIFERSLVETTNTGLFNRETFSKLALKNPPCGSTAIDEGILNINEKVIEINEWAKALECFIPRNDGSTPSALEIANVMGLYSIILKVFITQEYLKNIFVFSLYRISDISRSEVYMNYIYENVLQKIVAFEGTGAGGLRFQEHALVLVKARADYGDNIPFESLQSTESAVRFLIMEASVEIANVLDNRIQEQVLTPQERKKYEEFLQIGDQTADLSENFIGNFIEYVTYPEILTPGTLAPIADEENNLVFSSTQYQNVVPPKGGGLFFQEYFEISSKFATKDGSVDLTNLIRQKINSAPPNTSYAYSVGADYPGHADQFDYPYIKDGNLISDHWLANSGTPQGGQDPVQEQTFYFKNIIIDDPTFSFLVRPGVVLDGTFTQAESLSDEDYCVWSNLFGTKVEITNPQSINKASADSFRYRGKTDLNVSIPYYQESTFGLDEYLWPKTSSLLEKVSWAKKENPSYSSYNALADTLILNSLTLNAPYTDWFKPIKYGMRLMVSIPKTDAGASFFDTIVNSLNLNDVDSETENYIKLLEDKVIHYKEKDSDDPGHLVFPLIDVSEEMIQNTLPSVRELFALVIPSMLTTGQLNEGERRYRLLKKLVERIQTDYQDLFKKIIPIKELVLMVSLYHRIAMESMYPEIDSLFDSTTKDTLDALNMQFAAIDKDYQYDTQDYAGVDTDMDWGPLILSVVKMAVGASANLTDPTWRTPWFLPGPATPVGVIAKILKDVSIDLPDGTVGGQPLELNDDGSGLEGTQLVNQGDECEGEVKQESSEEPAKPAFLIKPS